MPKDDFISRWYADYPVTEEMIDEAMEASKQVHYDALNGQFPACPNTVAGETPDCPENKFYDSLSCSCIVDYDKVEC